MINRFHINPETGEARTCRAELNCPFGGDDEHFETVEQAREHAEAVLRNKYGQAALTHRKSAKTIEKGETIVRIDELKDLRTFLFNTTSVRQDHEENKIIISVRARDIYKLKISFFGEKGKTVDQLLDQYPDEVENHSGILDPELAATFILHEEEKLLNERLGRDEIEKLRDTFLRSKEIHLYNGYMYETASFVGNESTGFEFAYSLQDETIEELSYLIEERRNQIEKKEKRHRLERKGAEAEAELEQLRNELSDDEYNDLREVSIDYGAFITDLSIDRHTNTGVVEVDVDEWIERKYSHQSLVLDFHNTSDYEGSYEWKLNENGEWQFQYSGRKMREHTLKLIVEWEQQQQGEAREAFNRVGIRNVLLHHRARIDGGLYFHELDIDDASESYDEILSTQNEIKVEIVQDRPFFDPEVQKERLIEWLIENTDPEED